MNSICLAFLNVIDIIGPGIRLCYYSATVTSHGCKLNIVLKLSMQLSSNLSENVDTSLSNLHFNARVVHIWYSIRYWFYEKEKTEISDSCFLRLRILCTYFFQILSISTKMIPILIIKNFNHTQNRKAFWS